jgi:hypothetical protein
MCVINKTMISIILCFLNDLLSFKIDVNVPGYTYEIFKNNLEKNDFFCWNLESQYQKEQDP